MATPKYGSVYLNGNGQRRQGMTRNQHACASLHGDRLRQAQKIKSPSPEDVNAPPRDSSDEEFVIEEKEGLAVADAAIQDGRKERIRRENASTPPNHGYNQEFSSTHEKDKIVSSQRSSQKRSSDEFDNMTDIWGQRKKIKTGAKPRQIRYCCSQKTTANIHDSPRQMASKSSKVTSRKKSAQTEKQGKGGFKIPPGGGIRKRGSSSDSNSQARAAAFIAPPPIKNAPARANNSQNSAKSKSKPIFNAPRCPSLRKESPKGTKPEPAFKAYGASSPALRYSKPQRKPFKFIDPNASPSKSQCRDALNAVADKLGIDDIENVDPTPSSSVPTTTYPSSSFVHGSQSSGLSTPPDSPSKARCPLCKSVIDRLFLEGYAGNSRLNVRRQAEFCKAHKMKAAHDQWKDRGYPDIQWSNLDHRLIDYHSAIEDLLHGGKFSFYRNAFENSIRTGKNRTLKQTMMQGHTLEGLSPGYYGSRGAKIMVDSIIARFASKLRRLSGSDKVISSAGVSGYVQAVLAPEMAVLVVMDDMKTDEDGAREVLRESADIGNLLNEEEDDAVRHEPGAEDEVLEVDDLV